MTEINYPLLGKWIWGLGQKKGLVQNCYYENNGMTQGNWELKKPIGPVGCSVWQVIW